MRLRPTLGVTLKERLMPHDPRKPCLANNPRHNDPSGRLAVPRRRRPRDALGACEHGSPGAGRHRSHPIRLTRCFGAAARPRSDRAPDAAGARAAPGRLRDAGLPGPAGRRSGSQVGPARPVVTLAIGVPRVRRSRQNKLSCAPASLATRAGLWNRSVRSVRDVSWYPRRRAAISKRRPIIQA